MTTAKHGVLHVWRVAELKGGKATPRQLQLDAGLDRDEPRFSTDGKSLVVRSKTTILKALTFEGVRDDSGNGLWRVPLSGKPTKLASQAPSAFTFTKRGVIAHAAPSLVVPPDTRPSGSRSIEARATPPRPSYSNSDCTGATSGHTFTSPEYMYCTPAAGYNSAKITSTGTCTSYAPAPTGTVTATGDYTFCCAN